nr:hypothetical protein [Mucilaginibacter sp. X4EP1]
MRVIYDYKLLAKIDFVKYNVNKVDLRQQLVHTLVERVFI